MSNDFLTHHQKSVHCLTHTVKRTFLFEIQSNRNVVKEEPVSMTRQTIYCIIPILDIYAAYRVKRLRWYLLIMLLAVGVPLSITESILFPPDGDASLEEFANFWLFYYNEPDHFVFSIAAWIVTMAVAIFLIRRWSAQWNQRFA